MHTFVDNKVIRLRELVQVVGLARSTLYDIQNPKSSRFDPTFPAKVRLSGRAVGWFWVEVQAWLKSRPIVNHKTN